METLRRTLSPDAVAFENCASVCKEYLDALEGYFGGNVKEFSFALDLGRASDFDRAVWKATRKIPYGEIETYGGIAAKIGRPGAARAVGGALGRNPLPIPIPCHRVVRRDGSPGGFSAGIEWKHRLLALEANFASTRGGSPKKVRKGS